MRILRLLSLTGLLVLCGASFSPTVDARVDPPSLFELRRGLAVALSASARSATAGPRRSPTGGVGAEADTADTKLLTQPAISASKVAFIYAGDLFVADLNAAADVSNVRRLTTDDGVESNPVFSPDGRTIAFSAQYDGNVDVFTVPVTGGAPTRLTWHPLSDTVQSFTPAGKAVLFTSQRATFTGRYAQLFTVPVEGGMEEALPIPNAARATYSPDGQRIAYNPIGPRFQQWKQYRGAPCRSYGCTTRRDTRSRRFRSRSRAPTTRTRCGSATRCTSARVAPASSTCLRTTRKASRSARSPGTPTFRCSPPPQAPAVSSTSRPVSFTCSSRSPEPAGS